jgi:ATP-dependent RNA helicase RhlE
VSFQSLGLCEPILRGIAAAGFEAPTPIQQQAIPLVMGGKDLVGLGQTGSGKTAAYGLPMLDRLARQSQRGLRGLILVPTRELCVQVAENLRVFAQFAGLEVRTAFGGIPLGVQEAAFKRGVDVLVACPGRLLDHMQYDTIKLDQIEMLVLDEADRMLDMGFMPQIGRILSRMPRERQNMLFSATMPPDIDRLVKDHFGDPQRIQVGARSQAASTITHRFQSVAATDKEAELERLLRRSDDTVLVFVKTKKRCEELGRKLKRAGLPAESIHGDKTAEARHVVLQGFIRGKVRHLVATDVAARGIDVSDIGLVVNFDMPRAVEDYIHRVGRTGRAGTSGEALTLVGKLEQKAMREVLDHLGKTSVGGRVIVDGKQVLGPKSDAPASGDERSARSRRDERDERDERAARAAAGRRGGAERRESDAPRVRNSGGERESVAVAEPPPRRPRRAAMAAVTLGRDVDPTTDDGFGAGLDDPPAPARRSHEETPRKDRRR